MNEQENGQAGQEDGHDAAAGLRMWAVVTARTLHELLSHRPTYAECLEAAAAYSRSARGVRYLLSSDDALIDAMSIQAFDHRQRLEGETLLQECFLVIHDEELRRVPSASVAADLGDVLERLPYRLEPMEPYEAPSREG